MRNHSGLTNSEKYLQQLCDGTFLSIWSHPNVFKDQRIAGPGTDGKEVCDLLVVFGDTIIIFSDKNCAFKDTGRIDIDWGRWYRNAIVESHRQLVGAENWIRRHPDRLFRDRACTIPFPLPIPNIANAKFHRILVAHGAAAASMKFWGGSGSLMVDYPGKYPLSHDQVPPPFTIGPIGKPDQVVHIFDDNTVDLVLGQLDTITDFVRYLEKKEELILSGISIYAEGEEDMLADYLQHVDESGAHRFSPDSQYNAVVYEGGLWNEFVQSDHRERQIQADRISYIWDGLIEHVWEDIGQAPQHHPNYTNEQIAERIFRYMAAEPRLNRRGLGRSISEVLGYDSQKNNRYCRMLRSSGPGRPAYVIMTLENTPGMEYEHYREVRIELLETYCLAYRHKSPGIGEVIGIGADYGSEAGRSFDFLLADEELSDHIGKEEVRQKAREYDMFSDMKPFFATEVEYPEAGKPFSPKQFKMKGHDRNMPCRCGSGIKFKYCCGSRSSKLSY